MHLRRSLALVSGALLLTAPLASCGFDLATDRVNTIAPGATDRDATVDVLNAVIVSAEQGSGVFVTTLVNNDTEEVASLEGLEPVVDGVGSDPDEVTEVAAFSPVDIPPGGLVNLATQAQQPIEISGDFGAGDVVTVSVVLSGGQSLRMDVPVVPHCPPFDSVDGLEVVGGVDGDCEVSEPVGDHG